MKKMKKVLVGCLLATCMMWTVVGCSQNKADSSSKEGQKTTTAADKTEKSNAGVKWPEGTVTFSIPGTAGGGSDLTSRYLAQALPDVKLSLMNFNSTNAAFKNIANQKPDGRNIGLAHSALMTSYVAGDLDINPIKDLTIIAAIGNNGLRTLAVPKNAPYSTLDEFVKYAKQNPGKIKAGTSPSGTAKFAMGVLEQALDIKLNYVEASQESDRLTSLAGGFIDIGTVSLKNGLEYEKAGKLKVIATVGDNGSKIEDFLQNASKNFLTCQQMGYKDLYNVTYYYVVGPAGMDPELVKKINESMKDIASKDSAYTKGMKEMGQVAEWHNIEESKKLYEADLELMKKVGKNLGLYKIKD